MKQKQKLELRNALNWAFQCFWTSRINRTILFRHITYLQRLWQLREMTGCGWIITLPNQFSVVDAGQRMQGLQLWQSVHQFHHWFFCQITVKAVLQGSVMFEDDHHITVTPIEADTSWLDWFSVLLFSDVGWLPIDCHGQCWTGTFQSYSSWIRLQSLSFASSPDWLEKQSEWTFLIKRNFSKFKFHRLSRAESFRPWSGCLLTQALFRTWGFTFVIEMRNAHKVEPNFDLNRWHSALNANERKQSLLFPTGASETENKRMTKTNTEMPF